MTRKEEIEQGASIYADTWCRYKDPETCVEKELCKTDFVAGAEWADNHPVIKVGGAAKNYRRGYEDAVNKACEWLKDNFQSSPYDSTKVITHFSDMDDVVSDFRKAMEE